MKIIYNNIIPFKGFKAINLCGFVFARKGQQMSVYDLTHEKIHTAQMRELLYVFFYLWYYIEWIVRLFTNKKKAYFSISFEQEAYSNEMNMSYLPNRKRFAWIKFLRRNK